MGLNNPQKVSDAMEEVMDRIQGFLIFLMNHVFSQFAEKVEIY